MINAQDILSQTPSLNLMLACQPVVTRGREVAAFDLILQPPGDPAVGIDDIQTVVPVMLENCARIFQHGKMLSVPSFVRLSPQMLLDDRLPELPRQALILDICADTAITPEQIDNLQMLAREGYRLSLRNYQPARADLLPLLDTVHIVRLDLASLKANEELSLAMELLGHRNIKLLADGITTGEQFRHCLELGFTYFQGTFLSEVAPIEGRRIGGNKLLLLQLLEKLREPAVTAASLEALAIRDANLTYRILRVVNSAALGTRREVDTLSQAITLLGTEEIERWVNLFLIEPEPGKSGVLTRNMLVRGRMCEILADLDDRPLPVNHFIVGLLSQLDAMMDISMDQLVEQLPLGRETKLALLQREGSQGEILAQVEHYEQGRFEQLGERFDPTWYEVAYRHACSWARQVQQELNT